MAFDWTKVEGYRDDMTAEEKLALLQDMGGDDEARKEKTEEEKPADEEPVAPVKPKTPMIPKSQFDKLASELASMKKQLRSRMTDDEQKEAERQAQQDELMKELENLRREKTLSALKASYLSLGYDDKSAEEAATYMADGDHDMVFEMSRRHLSQMEKNLRAKILKETPVPPAGNDPGEAKQKAEMASLREAFGLSPLR